MASPATGTLDFGLWTLDYFQSALSHVCLELAKMIVRDGEGVSRFVTVRVNGARSFADADAAARAVANSALVKTSWHGGDPNWGRIIAALGYSPATIVEEKVDIGYSAPGSRKILWSLKVDIGYSAPGSREILGASSAASRPRPPSRRSAPRSPEGNLTSTLISTSAGPARSSTPLT